MKIKSHIIISLLSLSVGLSQQVIHTEIYDSENIKSITYHKKTRDKIEIVKFFNYYESGQKKEEGSFKDGKEDGLKTWWYENGQKMSESSYKDGILDGLWTNWYKNGQKKIERTYKDGKLFNIIGRWNKDGSVRKEPLDWE